MFGEILSSGLRQYGLSEETSGFRVYYDCLKTANKSVNLTAIQGDKDTAVLHFLDSLALLTLPPFDRIQDGAEVIDIGSGAGFPGLPLKIARQGLRVTLLDAREKRVDFLRETVKRLKITDIECVHSRAEDFAAVKREGFDYAVSRAVAELRVLAELALPFVRVGGFLVAMKSQDSDAEIKDAYHAVSILGGEPAEITDYALYDGTPRRIAVIRKTSPTPEKYPRRYKKISAQPL